MNSPEYPPDDVIAAWCAACKCCRECADVPCGAVQQCGACELACRCDEDATPAPTCDDQWDEMTDDERAQYRHDNGPGI